MHFIDGMLKRGIPLKVFHFDCFWMKDFHWTDLVWDERVFPDPAGMISRIHEKGLKCCVWINPYIAQESILFDEGMENFSVNIFSRFSLVSTSSEFVLKITSFVPEMVWI